MPVHSRATILLTRPRAASERFAGKLPGLDVIVAPLMEIVGTGAEIDLDGIAGLVLTSEATVSFLPDTDLPAYCVGPGTTQAARDAGLDAVQVGDDADALLATLLSSPPDGPLLHVHGCHQRGDVAQRLSAGGLPTDEIVAYDQRAVAPDGRFHGAIARDDVLIPLFSPRSADLFSRHAKALNPGARIFAMSAAVAGDLAADLRDRTTIIAQPNGMEMARSLIDAAMRRNSP